MTTADLPATCGLGLPGRPSRPLLARMAGMTTIDWIATCRMPRLLVQRLHSSARASRVGKVWLQWYLTPKLRSRTRQMRKVRRVPRSVAGIETRSAMLDDHRAQEAVQNAQRLLVQIVTILNGPICENHRSAHWSLRLARAHALTLLDHLARMADSPSVSHER